MNDVSFYHHSTFDLYLDSSQIPDSGLGVFTREQISENSLIDEYLGEIYDFNPLSSYTLEVMEGYYIDAVNFPRCYMAMINDPSFISKKIKRKGKRKIDLTPEFYKDEDGKKLEINCRFVKDVSNKTAKVYSIKEISPGCELFISYGPNFWNLEC